MLIIHHIIFNRGNVIMYSTRLIKNILRIVTITTATGIHLWFDSNMIKHHIVADTPNRTLQFSFPLACWVQFSKASLSTEFHSVATRFANAVDQNQLTASCGLFLLI